MHRQFDELLSAGIDVAVVSWWGQKDKPYAADTQGVNTDEIMKLLIEQADLYNELPHRIDKTPIKLAFHLEPYPTRTIASIKEDIEYITEKYSHHKCLYKAADGRMVYYVYDSYHILPLQWARMLDIDGDLSIRGTVSDGIFLGLWLHHHHGRDIKYGHFDGFYTYFGTDGFSFGSTSMNWANICRFASKESLISSISVGPGYNDTAIRPWNKHNERNRADGRYYENMWNKAIKAKPDMISITSYNEWGEGTQIEPARSFSWLHDKKSKNRGEEDVTQDGMSKRRMPQMGITAEQLRSGVDIEELTKDLEDLSTWNFDDNDQVSVELFSTPFAEVAIGDKAKGLRENDNDNGSGSGSGSDSGSGKSQLGLQERSTDLPGIGRATQRFTGEAYYDEGDSDGDGVTDSGGDMLDFHLDSEKNALTVDERKHITTKKLEELREQKKIINKLNNEKNEGVQFPIHTTEFWNVMKERGGWGYSDYGKDLGPKGYLKKTKEYSAKFIQGHHNQQQQSRTIKVNEEM